MHRIIWNSGEGIDRTSSTGFRQLRDGEDYGDVRDAASDGIRQAGCEPVRAEDFSATSVSPPQRLPQWSAQRGCSRASARCAPWIRGAVRAGGDRGGIQRSTEEPQANSRVSPGWGLTRAPTAGLRRQGSALRGRTLAQGLRWSSQSARARAGCRCRGGSRSRPRSPSSGRGTLSFGAESAPPEAQNVVWLQTVWTTLRDEEVVDPLDLGDGAFQRRVQHVAHECEPPLFDYEERKRVLAETSALRVEQGDFDSWGDGRHLAIVEIHADGTLVTAQSLTDSESRVHGVGGVSHTFDMYFLDPDMVRVRLNEAWSFASAWWANLDPHLRHEPLLYAVAVYDIGARNFARSGSPRKQHHDSPRVPGEPIGCVRQATTDFSHRSRRAKRKRKGR